VKGDRGRRHVIENGDLEASKLGWQNRDPLPEEIIEMATGDRTVQFEPSIQLTMSRAFSVRSLIAALFLLCRCTSRQSLAPSVIASLGLVTW
jgi:hypothetical protein